MTSRTSRLTEIAPAPKGWRRVTKAEDAAAHKAKRYTRAAPGKFRKSSKTISQNQYEKKRYGMTRSQRTKDRQTIVQSIPHFKGRQTRALTRDLRDMEDKFAELTAKDRTQDAHLILKYKREGWSGLSEAEKLEFKHIWNKYPNDKDLLRGWLGSDEKSRYHRHLFDMHVSTRGLAA